MENVSVNYDVMTPVRFLERAASVYADKTAVVYGEKRYTYRTFFERVNRLASALYTAGIRKGDKVAFICPNTPPMLEAHYAVPLIGATLVNVNTRLSSDEVAYILDHSDTRMAFVDNAFADLVLPILDGLPGIERFVTICDEDDSIPIPGMDYESFLMAGDPEPVACAVTDEREVACLNYTSGTTGKPKGVMYHHRGAFLNALGEVIEFGLSEKSVYLWTLPMFHCNGWCFTWAVTAVGGTHVCLRRVEADRIYTLIESEKVTHLCAAPTVLISLSAYAAAHDIRLVRPLELMTAGAPPAPQVIRNMEALGVNITQTYGLTEVFGPHVMCKWDGLSPEERAGMKAQQGVPYVHAFHLDVWDPQTMRPVSRDGQTIGEIVMRGNNVMSGYYKAPRATEEAFAGGWFHSGDLAVIHPDGYIQIMDRKKDIIVSGGENISTVEVENAICKHPDVLEVAVVASPHPKWGEVPKAYVTLKPGRNPSEQDIINFCKQKIARFKAPQVIEFGELPKTATGEIQKFKLRAREWEGQERRIA